jgi:hypothetical protein
MPMMAMTTNSSTRVKPRMGDRIVFMVKPYKNENK